MARPGSCAGQTVECTLAKGWAVAARRRARVTALRGKARKRHEDLTTTVIKTKTPGAEPRKVAHAIPRTFGDLAQAAAKDNNKLQMKVNVHEHALDWIRIYEGKHNETQRELCIRAKGECCACRCAWSYA